MNTLTHHGILGQRWGKRNGPPYPLNASNHSQSEKKAGWRRSLDRSTGGIQNESSKRGLSDRQKKAIKVGATLAVTALAAYGGYKLYKSGKLDGLLSKGKRLARQPTSGAPKPDHLNEAVQHGFKKLDTKESFSERAKAVNPYGGDGGRYNCWSCGIAGYLRSKGIDVKARSAEVGLRNLKERYSTFIKDIDSHTMEGNGSQFGKTKLEAEKAILERFKEEGAEGVCSVSWTRNRGAHVFNWRIENGAVKFFDYQLNHHSDEFDFNRYFSQIDENKYFFCTRLDDAEIDWDNITKFVRK